MNPCWTGSSTPSCSRPSTVRTSWPPAIAASTVQVFTGSPSSQATQVPQLLVSQPQCVPVSPSSSRRKCTRSRRPSISRVTGSPLTVIETCMSFAPVAVALHAVALDARLDTLHGSPKGAAGQLVGQVALVVRGPAVVRGRRAARRGDGPRADEELLGGPLPTQGGGDLRDAGGVGSDRSQAHPGVGDHLAVHPHRGAGRGDRPVPGPPLDLGVGAGPVRAHREPDLGEHLPVLHGRLVGTPVEV